MTRHSDLLSPKVLVVDDDPRLRQTLTQMLQTLEFPATCAGSSEEAMRILRDGVRVDIVILDLQLPGMHGINLFQWLAEGYPDVEVIVLTGFGDLKTAQRSIRLGVVDFLTKPCTMGDLDQALNRAWSQPKPAEDPLPDAKSSQFADLDFEDEPPARTLEETEYRQIIAALQRHGGNRRLAAAELQISLRTLYYRLARYQS